MKTSDFPFNQLENQVHNKHIVSRPLSPFYRPISGSQNGEKLRVSPLSPENIHLT